MRGNPNDCRGLANAEAVAGDRVEVGAHQLHLTFPSSTIESAIRTGP
jgi:hypothetical protein